jgi:hypothetical protein
MWGKQRQSKRVGKRPTLRGHNRDLPEELERAIVAVGARRSLARRKFLIPDSSKTARAVSRQQSAITPDQRGNRTSAVSLRCLEVPSGGSEVASKDDRHLDPGFCRKSLFRWFALFLAFAC